MVKEMTLYKYRSFQNIEFVLDIFLNKRLFAAKYEKLNDPMEGRYIYERGSLTPTQLHSIRGSKAAYNLLSLSRTYRNMLMWSYYAEGHKGFTVGVRINDRDAITEPVSYVDDLDLGNNAVGLNNEETAKYILTRKL